MLNLADSFIRLRIQYWLWWGHFNLGQYEGRSSRSVQLFLQGSRLRQTNWLTDRQKHYTTQSATIGCTYIVVGCRLIISCAILWWKMLLTSHTISIEFIMSIYIRLRTFWMPLIECVVYFGTLALSKNVNVLCHSVHYSCESTVRGCFSWPQYQWVLCVCRRCWYIVAKHLNGSIFLISGQPQRTTIMY